MVREDWLCLNGRWDLRFLDQDLSILVPFCPESLLSGVETAPPPGTLLRYRRFFTLPESWQGKRVLLHFGAVMGHAAVLVNGRELCRHENGYLPFTVEVTEALQPGKNELQVLALNDLDPRFPRGKQRADRGGRQGTGRAETAPRIMKKPARRFETAGRGDPVFRGRLPVTLP